MKHYDFIFLKETKPKYKKQMRQIAKFCKENNMHSDLIRCPKCRKRYWLTYYHGNCPHCGKSLDHYYG